MAVLLVLGGAFLSRQISYRKAAQFEIQAVQAEALARAGLEDFRVKWERDSDFPPADQQDPGRFTYSETLPGLDGRPVGVYLVEVDTRFREKPGEFLRVASTGILTPYSPQDEPARTTLVGEFDLSDRHTTLGLQGRWLNLAGDDARR